MSTAASNTVRWTPQQQRGIETTGRSLLVSAAAGSGKTAVLAARCGYLVCDAPPEHRCDVDQLLVVTFTRAAASEMRSRIEQALRQRLGASESDDARLARQIMLLDRAGISTLHSFCTNVLRRHFNVVGLDPNFRMLDEDEAFLLRIETARQLLAERYEADTLGEFQAMIDSYAEGDDERLLKRVIHAHNMLCSIVDPRGWLTTARDRIAEAARGPLGKSELGREMAGLIQDRLSDFRRRCIDAVKQFSRSEPLVPYAEWVNELIAALEGINEDFQGENFDKLSAAIKAFPMPKLPRMASTVPGKEDAKKQIDKLRDELSPGGALHDLCRFSGREWQEGLAGVLPGTDIFVDLVGQFTQRYTAAKAEVGVLDFNDLERLTLQVLRGPDEQGRLSPSGTARAYHAQFRHVLVDEYQDINEVQDAILSLVSRDCISGQEGAVQNLFCVGDVKQSIYRFRLADPRRFLDRDERLRTCGDPSIGEVIDLQSNFRSRPPLLDALNCVFERLMTAAAAEINYDQSHRLHPGAAYPPAGKVRCFEGGPIELHLLPSAEGSVVIDDSAGSADVAELELDRTEREAAFVAHRILQLLDDDPARRMHVMDRAPDGQLQPRPLRRSDIVILLRATQYKAAAFSDMLRACGVPVHADSGSGFFNSMEIRDLLALLSTLDNLQQDIPLAAVLRSPLSGLAEPENSLARIRLAYPGSAEHVPFHQAVARYALEQHDELAAHLRDLLGRLDGWRRLAQQRPLAEVLWAIYDSTGYLAFCAGLRGGEQRVANLIRLHERAHQFGSFQRQGLRRFMQFLQSLQDDEKDLGQPSVASEADDVVKIMSIHRSKGLEFPVVILPDLGKKHNLSDTAGPILIDRAAGLGLNCVDEAKRIRYPSMGSFLVQERIRRQSLAEELRVLYVAMTRAKEHLILVGTCKADQPGNWSRRWGDHEGALPSEEVLRSGCMLDWIGPVFAATEHMNPPPFGLTMHGEEEVRAWSAPATRRPQLSDRQQQVARLEPLEPPPAANPDAERIRQRLTGSYAFDPYTQLAAAQSVGSLKKHRQGDSDAEKSAPRDSRRLDEQLPAPRCVAESLSPSPTEVGSAVHRVLQCIDFSRPGTGTEIGRQIAEMVDRKLLSPAEAESVDVSIVEWLLSTKLGHLLRSHAPQVRRELPVFYPMPVGNSDDSFDRVMVRGRIDAMIPDPAGVILIDYKTDRVTAETIEDRTAFYRPQVESYGRAMVGITRKPVKAVHLVYLVARQIRTLPLPPP
jgi:ATP-dependent helicase/nuclease subunit A